MSSFDTDRRSVARQGPSVLVLGMDELSSAIARQMLLAGAAVAIHQETPPNCLRRRMSFADAWHDGSALLEGVEARKADGALDFARGMKSRLYIPVVKAGLDRVAGRWPWSALIDARPQTDRPGGVPDNGAELTIGVGPGFRAGRDGEVDVVIDSGRRDPGAVIRDGAMPVRDGDELWENGTVIQSPGSGLFQASLPIGIKVAAGDLLGWMGALPVLAPHDGQIRGLAHDGALVVEGAALAELVPLPGARIDGVPDRLRAIARAVALAVDMHWNGHSPVAFDGFA